MKKIVEKIINNKAQTMPILSFPSTKLLGLTVNQLITSSNNQARGMQAIANRCNISASLNMMDLSVEAEAFGATIRFDDNEIPTVIKGILDNLDDVDAITVPVVGDKRTGIYIDGVRQAKKLIIDKPIMCGVIGPYSLAGRLYDMTELMMACYDEPEQVEKLLEKCSQFIKQYIIAFKEAGADGVIMAEPASGLLSPELCEQFSSKYVKEIFEEINDDNFVLVYHNCGNTVPLIPSILSVNADIYHFGNAIDIEKVLVQIPHDKLVMGNINPVDFRTGTPSIIENETQQLLTRCSKYPHFVISSGCDIPADSKWENIDAYFSAVKKFYDKQFS